MLGVAELGRLGLVAKARRLVERQHLRLCGPQRVPGRAACLPRVDTLLYLSAHRPGLVAGLLERHVGVAAESKVGAIGPDLDAKYPATGVGVLHLEMQSGDTADRMQPWRGKPADLDRGKFCGFLGHRGYLGNRTVKIPRVFRVTACFQEPNSLPHLRPNIPDAIVCDKLRRDAMGKSRKCLFL